MTILKANNLIKTYGNDENCIKALNDVSLEVNECEFVAIVGTSGSGKSTLLNMLGGLDYPTSGEVYVRDKKLGSMKDEDLTIFRRRNIGFVFQNYNLIPVLNVYENIVLPLELDGIEIDTDYVNKLIKTLGLEKKINNMPNNLSGGQQQRVAIARALVTKPAIILADEPTGNLDTKTSMDVLSLLKMTSKKFNQTIIMITHNEEIAQLCDRIIRIEDGKIFSAKNNSYNNYSIMQKRITGTVAAVFLSNPTDDQIEKLQDLNVCDSIGEQVNAGKLILNDDNRKSNVSLIYYNDICFNKHIMPCISNVKGN